MLVPPASDGVAELLSIGIPTFNRAPFLKDLLLALEQQIQQDKIPVTAVRILVSDNASADATSEVVRAVAARLPHLTYFRHPQNIGFTRNAMTCVRQARGRYCWICGDDELLQAGGLKALLDLLKADPALSLVVNLRTGYSCRLNRPARFASYREYALACARMQPHILIEHTLVSSNVFRAELFDPVAAEAWRHTPYAHMYALLQPVIAQGGPVMVPAFPLLEVRDQRPPFAEWPANLEQSWLDYLGWQKQKLGLDELQPGQAILQVRQELFHKLTRHPFRYVRNNLRSVLKPSAWAFILKRLWLHFRSRPPAA